MSIRTYPIQVIFLWIFLSVIPCAAEFSEKSDTSKKIINVGFDSSIFVGLDVELKDIRSAVDLWAEEVYLNLPTYTKGKTIFYDSLEKLIQDFNDKKISLMACSALNYLKIESQVNAELAYVYVRNGKINTQYLLLVSSNSNFSNINDLNRKQLVLKEGDEIGSLFLNTLLLSQHHVEANDFFSSIINKKDYSQCILSVFFNQVDACIAPDTVFNTMIMLNPQVGKRLKILSSSPPFINDISVFQKEDDPKIKKDIERFILDVKKSAYGQQILILFKMEEVRQFVQSDLDNLRELLKRYHDLKKNVSKK